MARRVPKLLVPLMVALVAIAIAMWAVLPSSASEITPPVEEPQPVPSVSATASVPRPPKPGPTATFDPGPKDCADCANPGVD
jgi:hypothetical protein